MSPQNSISQHRWTGTRVLRVSSDITGFYRCVQPLKAGTYQELGGSRGSGLKETGVCLKPRPVRDQGVQQVEEI
ncbi:hypothetical protein J6590_054813 [Homalodisca vitripennis]|nr:hypothetical protein J6590_054813 [Homalodisca vitripennis]